MKNTFGSRVTLTLFGESRKGAVGCVIDGIAPGVRVDTLSIQKALAMRAPFGEISTERRDCVLPKILSGVSEGIAEGTPIALILENTDARPDGEDRKALPRPGHADYAQAMRYDGFCDLDGGGHASGRLTAPLVAAGAIFRDELEKRGIVIGTHIKSLFGVADRPFGDLSEDLAALREKRFPALSEKAEAEMTSVILRAKEEGDSVGGILECAVLGVPAGIGEPWFDALESTLSHALFAIPGVKGVSFGDGFSFAEHPGSEENDALTLENGRIVQKTNHNGGISGGITTGAPILISIAVRPTPSIAKEQKTLRLPEGAETVIASSGRNDPCIVHRVRAVADAVIAHVIYDALAVRFGDFLPEKFGG